MTESGSLSLSKSITRRRNKGDSSCKKDTWRRPIVTIRRPNRGPRGRRSCSNKTNSKNTSRVKTRTAKSTMRTGDKVRRSLLGALNASTVFSPVQPSPAVPTEYQEDGPIRRRSMRLSNNNHTFQDTRRPALIPGASNSLIESAFADIFDNARLHAVDIDQCVSLEELRVRPIHEFGVKRILKMLRGGTVGMVTGHVQVGKFPVIVELPSQYKKHASSYFVAKGRKQEISEKWVRSKSMYHVVNGGYEHEARCRLAAEEGCQFGGREWRALIIPW